MSWRPCARCTAQAADRQADAERRRRAGLRARAAERGGADAVSLINTLRAMAAVAPGARRPRRGSAAAPAGSPGPAIRPVALAQVAAVAARVEIPVIGMGGVQSAAHARELLDVGATLVAVGTESFRDPARGRRGSPRACS